MKNFILKNAMVVAAMAIAATSYALMSFGTAEMAKIEQEYPYRFYGVQDENGETFHWQSTAPTGLSCDPAPLGACSILSNTPTTPAPNAMPAPGTYIVRSEEHTSELQSRENLVCRLLLEKKKKN